MAVKHGGARGAAGRIGFGGGGRSRLARAGRAWHSGLVQPMQRNTSAGAGGRSTLMGMSWPGGACGRGSEAGAVWVSRGAEGGAGCSGLAAAAGAGARAARFGAGLMDSCNAAICDGGASTRLPRRERRPTRAVAAARAPGQRCARPRRAPQRAARAGTPACTRPHAHAVCAPHLEIFGGHHYGLRRHMLPRVRGIRPRPGRCRGCRRGRRRALGRRLAIVRAGRRGRGARARAARAGKWQSAGAGRGARGGTMQHQRAAAGAHGAQASCAGSHGARAGS